MFDRLRHRLFGKPTRIEPVLVGEGVDDACAALTMIARHHGRAIEPADVDRILPAVDPAMPGRTAAEVVDAAAQLGLVAKGLMLEHWGAYAKLDYPCIGHVRGAEGAPAMAGAFVVLESFDPATEQLSIIDPFEGRSVESLRTYFRFATGVVIAFEPGHALPRAVVRT